MDKIIEVKITYPNDDEKVYMVSEVFEERTVQGHFLVMGRLPDGKLGYIPMEVIENYEILK